MTAVTTEWKDLKKFQEYLNKISSQQQKTKTLEAIKNYMLRSTKKKFKDQDFETEGQSGLSDLTKKLKHKNKEKMLVDSGQLQQSIVAIREPNKVRIGTPLIYSKIHVKGGTIEPKKAKYLWVPATKEVADQVKKKDIKNYLNELEKKGYKIFRTRKKGGGLNRVVYRKKKDEKMELIFHLLDKVTIPKRNFLYISKVDTEKIFKILEFAIKIK